MAKKWGRYAGRMSVRLTARELEAVRARAEADGTTGVAALRAILAAGLAAQDAPVAGFDPAHNYPGEWAMPADALRNIRGHMDVSIVHPNGELIGSASYDYSPVDVPYPDPQGRLVAEVAP